MSFTTIEISKSALLNNVAAYRKLAGPAKLMAIVKANAYGHGVDQVTETINDAIDWFGVVNDHEAIHLRDNNVNKPILVLGYYEDDLVEELIRKNISVVLHNTGQLKQLEQAASKLKAKVKVHVKVDTGLARLGFSPEEALEIISKLATSVEV